MNETRDEPGSTVQQRYPRRRFIACLLAGVWGLAAKADPHANPGTTGPWELPLKEADYYRPHDLAG